MNYINKTYSENMTVKTIESKKTISGTVRPNRRRIYIEKPKLS